MNISIRLYFTLLLLLLFSIYAQGQTFNNRVLFVDNIAAMDFSNVIVKEDTIITIGRGAILVPPGYPGKLMISKFDFSGELINWFNDYGPDTLMAFIPYAGRSIYQKGDKMLVVGGAGGYFANDFGFVAMIDKHSTVNWLKVYPPTEDSYAYRYSSGLILDNNNLLILANRQSTGWFEDYPLSTILIHLDSLGNILWEREYKRPLTFIKSASLIVETDTTFLMGIRLTKDLLTDNRSAILRINQNGDILHEWHNDNPKTFSPKKIFKTPDGGFVFVSKYFKEISDSGNRLYQGYICKLDGDLNKEWELKLGHRSVNTYFHSMMQTYDGKFIAVGAVTDTFQTLDQWRGKGWVVKFDETGVIDWQQEVYSGIIGHNEIYDIAETDEHDLIVCGVSKAIGGDFPHQGWLLKLDEYGCLDPNWCDTTYVSTAPPPEPGFLQLSPNPAHSSLKISFENTQTGIGKAKNIQQIRIFNLMGQEFTREAYSGQRSVSIDVAFWPSGLYIVVVNERWVRKVFVQ